MDESKKLRFSFITNYLILVALFFITFSAEINASQGFSADSSDQKPGKVFMLIYNHGYVIPTNVFVKGENRFHRPINSFRSLSLQFSKQTSGNKLWEQLYNFPRYGAGINISYFPDASYLGVPVSFYSALGIPIKRWNKFSIFSDMGLGIAFNWNTGKDDPYNIAIGSPVTLYFNEGLSVEYKSVNGLILSAGAGLTHFSNGSVKVPNRGINTISPRVCIGYNFDRAEGEFKHQTIPEFKKQSDCFISAFGAVRNDYYYGTDVDSLTKYRGVYYGTYGISFAFERLVSRKSVFGFGFMADYYGMANSSVTVENGRLVPHPASFRNGLEISVFPSYELVMNKLSAILQHGFYLYRSDYPFRNPVGYQRVGLRFNVISDLSVSVYMRLHDYGIADYIEWTLGYKLHL